MINAFQQAETVTLNHEETGKNSQKISKFKPFIKKYNWKETIYPSGKDNWKSFKKNNPNIAPNVLNVIYHKYAYDKSCLKFRNHFQESPTLILQQNLFYLLD